MNFSNVVPPIRANRQDLEPLAVEVQHALGLILKQMAACCGTVFQSGPLANLPDSTSGQIFYYATDTGQLLVNSGSAWFIITTTAFTP